MRETHIDEDGYTYEERPHGRREYVDSPKLANLRRALKDAQHRADNLWDEFESFDYFDSVDQPEERHSIHQQYLDACITCTGIDAAITRERFRLMQRGSDYGFINADGERVPYDDDMPTGVATGSGHALYFDDPEEDAAFDRDDVDDVDEACTGDIGDTDGACPDLGGYADPRAWCGCGKRRVQSRGGYVRYDDGEREKSRDAARRIIADYMGVDPDDVHILCSGVCGSEGA